MAVLAANQLEAWCATQAALAALASGMVTTALHPLGSLEDPLFQLQDFSAEVLVADGGTVGPHATELAQRHASSSAGCSNWSSASTSTSRCCCRR